MKLSDIQSSISEKSDEELRDLLMGIRSNRRVSKKPEAAPKKRASTTGKGAKSTSELSMNALLNALNPEQIAELMAKIGGK